jgi:hypothetical protein
MIGTDVEDTDNRTVTSALVTTERHIEDLRPPGTGRAVTNGTSTGELNTQP